jgi:hypothetical protein
MRTTFFAVLLLCTGFLHAQEKPSLGQNLITITPMMIMSNESMDDDTDVGVGINYERILNDGLIGIKLPFNFSLRNPGFYYFMPTVKLYPTRQGVVRYAVGPQFYVATGTIKHKVSNYYWDGNNYIYNETQYHENHTQLGFMINNSLNVTISRNLYIGMELALGIRYYDSFDEDKNDNSFSNEPVSPNVQFSFSMGYRF